MMKRFMKTITGKTILFILCIFTLAAVILSSLAAFLYIEEDFYTKEKGTLYEEIIDGKLENDFYDLMIDNVHEDNAEAITEADRGNLIFRISDDEGKAVVSSEGASSLSSFDGNRSYYVIFNEEGNIQDIYNTKYSLSDEVKNNKIYTVDYAIADKEGVNDFYSFVKTFFEPAYALRYWIYGIIVCAALALIGSFVALMSVSGRVNDSDEIEAGPLNFIPFDLLCAGCAALFVLYCLFCGSISHSDMSDLIMIVIGILLAACLLLGLCMSMASRIKQKTLLRKSFCWWVIEKCLAVIRWIWQLFIKTLKGILSFCRQIPLVWKSALIISAACLIEIVIMISLDCSEEYVVFWFLRSLILVPAVLYLVMCMRRLQKGSEALAAGDLSYQIDTKHMYYDLKKHGEDLNSIAKGMSIAVEERMKSERMKTELITNVSHDIKTPLTSIINYADLISKEKSLNKRTKEYAEVLLKQSERLKRLLEDLVEASKASTGNLEVNLAPCDASMFILQSQGEYADRFEQADLTLICEKPDHEVMIMADGRRMWRIFDNLMSNICKYAQSGTRVYLSLKEEDDKAVITFRNTSRDELNISEEELMERFTRGDASRSSEGNGLGLSIARSLAELQSGTMDLSIDGDLFKVILSFPLI